MALAKPREQLNAEGRWIGTEAIYDLLDSHGCRNKSVCLLV